VTKRKSTWDHLLEGVYIFFGSGILAGILFYFLDYNFHNILLVGLFTGVMWTLMWKGNEIIACHIDRYVSWLKNPAKRFFIGLAAVLIYVPVMATLVNLLMDWILNRNLDFRDLSNGIIQSTLIAVMFTILVMLIIYSISFFKSWRQAAINMEKLKRENISSQYEILKNQVNPHFLFNTLNALTSLIYEDRDKAVRFINKFSDVYRYVLESRNREVVAIAEELEFVSAYSFLLQTRYEENLSIKIPENNVQGFIPPMSLQLLVENAVKHNVISDGHPLFLKIRIDGQRIQVENNITEPRNNPDRHESIGLKNIVSRFEILTDQPVKIEKEQGIFRVILPVLQMEPS
jgi:two-component system LytT family sensor kinase